MRGAGFVERGQTAPWKEFAAMTAETKIGADNDELLCSNARSDQSTRMSHLANATIGPRESRQEEPR